MTITSNLHIGLYPWASGLSYAPASRVASAGCAYQCAIAGVAGGGAAGTAPSGTGVAIADGPANTGAFWTYLSPIDYASLADWAAGLPALLTEPAVGLLWNDAPLVTLPGVAYLVLAGHITSAINTVTLTCAPGESFRDTLHGVDAALAVANGVAFHLPPSAGNCIYIDISDSNVIIDAIQFIDPLATSQATVLQSEGGTTNVTVQNCLFDGYSQDNSPIIEMGGVTGAVVNNLIVDRASTGTMNVGLLVGAAATAMAIVNCTAVNVGSAPRSTPIGVAAGGGGVIVRNCALYQYANPLVFGITADHCATDAHTLGSATDGGNNILNTSSTDEFVSAADFRLSGLGDCGDNGVIDLTAIPTATDIFGYARPQGAAWSIGAAEYPAQLAAQPNVGAVGAMSALVQTVLVTAQIGLEGLTADCVAVQTDIMFTA
jgi:hypothetical protein